MTRDEFVPAGEMELGEQVVALEGQLWRLTSITSRAGPESVYNFEVAGEHVYYVGSDGLLVQNAYNTQALRHAVAWSRTPLGSLVPRKYIQNVLRKQYTDAIKLSNDFAEEFKELGKLDVSFFYG